MSESTSSATMTLDNSEFIAGMDKARASMAQLKEAMSSISESLAGLSAQFVTPALATFTKGINDAMQQGRQFADQAKQTGQSVATLVELKQAFESAGVSGESVTDSLFALNKAMDDTNAKGKPAADTFAKLGLSLGDLKKMNGVEQFQAIIKGLQGLPDAAGRAAAAQQIFGDKSREIMGVLNDPKGFNTAIQGSAGYAKSMQDNAGSFQKVGEAAEQVQANIKACYAAVAGGLAPALEGMFELVQKINLPEVGADLGRGIAFAFEAFKEGKVFEMIKLNLTIAFKEAINTLYAGIQAAGAALQVVFANLPKLLSDAFSMVTNAKFWEGVGDLLLGAIKGIQGELTKIFFSLADALGNRLADVLDKIPLLKDIAEQLRQAINRGNEVVQTISAHALGESTQLTNKATTEIAGASKNVAGDVTDIRQKAQAAAQNAIQQSQPLLDATQNQVELNQDVQTDVFNALKAQQSNPTSTTNTPIDSSSPVIADTDKNQKKPQQKKNSFDHFKAPDVDRFAKLGLFIGGAPQAPGLSEARRTANATEKALKSLDTLIAFARSSNSPTTTVYG